MRAGFSLARSAGLLPLVLASALAGCAARERTTELARIDPSAGYRYGTIEKRAPKLLDDTAIVVTFSGGGMRAAALAFGALEALDETALTVRGQPTRLSREIDVVSSVSGGSVTAAYFALKGAAGLREFEGKFLRPDVTAALIGRTLLDPGRLAAVATFTFPRIEILEDYLDDAIFEHKTYQAVLDAEGPGAARRPYVVLNATDMATGSVFSFNQDQFDLICSDLARLRIADAVAASAAFPVALGALTLKNRARKGGQPCPAFGDAVAHPRSGWALDGGWPRPRHVSNDVATAIAVNPGRHRRGVVALSYLDEDNARDYVQLLDGGLADNLGLTYPLRLMTSLDLSPSIFERVQRHEVDKLLVVVVNARSEGGDDYGKEPLAPGVVSTLWTAIGTPIDSTSFLMLDRLGDLLQRYALKELDHVQVDFDYLPTPACRRAFKNIATSWTLAGADVTRLIELGRAMVLESGGYKSMVAKLGGAVPRAAPSGAEICDALPPRP